MSTRNILCVITNNTIFIFVFVVVELNVIINYDTYYVLIILRDYQVYSSGIQIVKYNTSTYIISRWLWNNIMCVLP